MLDEIRQTLKKKFAITETVNPSVITGVQVERNREKKWLKLHQEAYATQVLAAHGMTDCNGAPTPLDPGTAREFMLLDEEKRDEPDVRVVKAYQTLVGELVWC